MWKATKDWLCVVSLLLLAFLEAALTEAASLSLPSMICSRHRFDNSPLVRVMASTNDAYPIRLPQESYVEKRGLLTALRQPAGIYGVKIPIQKPLFLKQSQFGPEKRGPERWEGGTGRGNSGSNREVRHAIKPLLA